MNCDLTEKVSLLIDAELAPEEAARLREHIENCAACRQSEEAFLLLRQELRSYAPDVDPHVQSRALASILAPGTQERETAAARRGGPSAPRHAAGWLAGHLAGVFSGRHLQPAPLAALVLLLIGGVLAARWFVNSPDTSRTTPYTSRVESTNSAPAGPGAGSVSEAKKAQDFAAVDEPATYQAKAPKPARPLPVAANVRPGRNVVGARRGGHGAERQSGEGLSRGLPQEVARVGATASPTSPASAAESVAAEGVREIAADPALRIGRHAEQVEMLLRSFRNARLTEGDPTLDVADARRLSKRLLYNNITLRREAAGAGNLPVEGLLDSIEPTLLDISNLPDKPSPGAVVSIKERIRKRQLVGVLQAQVMLASR